MRERLLCVVESNGNGCIATNHITAELTTELFFTLKSKKKTLIQLILCYRENHEIWKKVWKQPCSMRGRMRGREGGWLKQTKKKKENIFCDLSFNLVELKMHLLSHWQADRVRTPAEQQSMAWPSCWWWGGFHVALFHNATLGNIKNSKGNNTEQG